MTPDPRPTLGPLERDLERARSAYCAALDDRDAPRLADGAPLSVAARIRALPR